MPAVSKKQRQLFAIAEHNPEKLHSENKNLTKLPKKTLHEFAATSERHLPSYAHARKARKESQ